LYGYGVAVAKGDALIDAEGDAEGDALGLGLAIGAIAPTSFSLPGPVASMVPEIDPVPFSAVVAGSKSNNFPANGKRC
jgi:hypothetical protein